MNTRKVVLKSRTDWKQFGPLTRKLMTMINKSFRLSFVFCLFVGPVNQSAMSQQQGAAPLYYHGIAGHFDANQTYANSGLIVDKVNADSPFQKMESFETGRIRTLRVGERISSLGDGTLG